MKITKILNSSVVLAVDDNGDEIVLAGKGIGYHHKVNDVIPLEAIEKVFVLTDKNENKNFLKLVKNTPQDYFEASTSIIEYAKNHLAGELNEHIFIALTDHISFAIDRHKQGMNIQNRLLWEIKKFYPNEFKVGEYAIEYLNRKFNIDLPEEEAGNIGFHFVNAQTNEHDMYRTMMMTNMLKDILNIVKLHFKIALDKDSLNYIRFITHLQFFCQRLLDNKLIDSSDDFLYEQVKYKYPIELECGKRIENYIKSTIGKDLTKDEMVYLTIHINRVTSRAE
jgi:beta-glucoside operon transcriptional antiterminator